MSSLRERIRELPYYSIPFYKGLECIGEERAVLVKDVEALLDGVADKFPKDTLAVFRNIAHAHEHGHSTVYKMKSEEIVTFLEWFDKNLGRPKEEGGRET